MRTILFSRRLRDHYSCWLGIFSSPGWVLLPKDLTKKRIMIINKLFYQRPPTITRHARPCMLDDGASGVAASRSGAGAISVEGAHLTRILIADDHEIVRLGLRAILEVKPGWKVVAEAADGKQAITQALASQPEIVIMDYSLPIMNGVDATRQICARLPKTKIMIFTIHDTDILAGELLDAGARAYVLKSEPQRYVVTAVESLICGRCFFNGRVYGRLLDPSSVRHCKDISPLSSRERVVVQLIAEGHSNKETAAILSLSVKTIETHRAVAMRKLNATSVASLVRYAIRNNLVEA